MWERPPRAPGAHQFPETVPLRPQPTYRLTSFPLQYLHQYDNNWQTSWGIFKDKWGEAASNWEPPTTYLLLSFPYWMSHSFSVRNHGINGLFLVMMSHATAWSSTMWLRKLQSTCDISWWNIGMLHPSSTQSPGMSYGFVPTGGKLKSWDTHKQ